MNLSFIDLTTTDPAFNLAAEEYVFEHMPVDRAYFMLWQNDNAIIIGKHQNTLAEINQKFVSEHGIKVVRRLSGGGAVYHDLGNLNFTFIANAENLDQLNFKVFCQPVIDALSKIGVSAEVNGRNDMTINGKKFSGNSQYVKNNRVMHHGTILFQSNLDVINSALCPDTDKIQAKGIKSVRSRVTNVADHLNDSIGIQKFRQILAENIVNKVAQRQYTFTSDDLVCIKQIQAARYDTWEWNYGRSPACTIHKKARIDGCGTVEVYLTVNNGYITEAFFRGDFFNLQDPAILASFIIGHKPNPEDITNCLSTINAGDYIANLSTDSLITLLNS